MRITVINGTQKHGVTFRLKELFLESFRERAEITEYELPRDCPAFCTGCISCVLKGEDTCKDAAFVQKIASSLLAADLIVMTSPAYVMHATGAMKALLDHLTYLWLPHRPAPEMFSKRAVIITQCLGAGARTAAQDIRHSLSWWGISHIRVFTGKLMGDIEWNRLSPQKQRELTRRIRRLSQAFARIDFARPAGTSLITRSKFNICRMMQKSLHQRDPAYLDGAYWAALGWLSKGRPWKK